MELEKEFDGLCAAAKPCKDGFEHFDAVDSLQRIKNAERFVNFVFLERADHMQARTYKGVPQGRVFCLRFLYPVFPEKTDSCMVGIENCFCGMKFRDSHQRNRLGGSACPLSGAKDSLLYSGDIVSNL